MGRPFSRQKADSIFSDDTMINPDNYFESNNLSISLMKRIVYECMLLQEFFSLCDKIDNDGIKGIVGCGREPKKSIRDYIVKNASKLNDEEMEKMIELIMAHVKGNGGRDSTSRVDALLKRQNNRCFACGHEKTKDECHDDHVIPYKYVFENMGIQNNRQALCRECNTNKNADPYFAIKLFIDCYGQINEDIRIFF